jgi:hypothetical protein
MKSVHTSSFGRTIFTSLSDMTLNATGLLGLLRCGKGEPTEALDKRRNFYPFLNRVLRAS